jgi:hypothetical protein
MHRLDHTNFHSFLKTNAWAVLFARPRSLEEFNPVIAAHFRSKYPKNVVLACVDLSDGHEWFARETRRTLGRSHGAYESAYYLVVAGKMVLHHAGKLNNGVETLLGILLTAASGHKDLTMSLKRRDAVDVIALFEEHLAKCPPRSTEAPAGGVPIEPYAALEIPRNASRAEVEAAYKRRVLEYHPDRVEKLGKDLRELAQRRMIEINGAHATLTKSGK